MSSIFSLFYDSLVKLLTHLPRHWRGLIINLLGAPMGFAAVEAGKAMQLPGWGLFVWLVLFLAFWIFLGSTARKVDDDQNERELEELKRHTQELLESLKSRPTNETHPG